MSRHKELKDEELARKRLHELVHLLPADKLPDALENLSEMIPTLKTETIPPYTPPLQAEMPEGVSLAVFEMLSEKYAEMVSTILDAITSGKYEFRSAVHLKNMVRTVMYKRGVKEAGTPLEMYAKDNEVAWSLQQTIEWAYRKIIRIVATRRENKVVETAYTKLGLGAPPEKDKLVYFFKQTDGWTLVGEQKP